MEHYSHILFHVWLEHFPTEWKNKTCSSHHRPQMDTRFQDLVFFLLVDVWIPIDIMDGRCGLLDVPNICT